jgi:hypothetical protein
LLRSWVDRYRSEDIAASLNELENATTTGNVSNATADLGRPDT